MAILASVVSALLAYAATSLPLRDVVAYIGIAVAFLAVRWPLGGGVVILVPFLLPDVRTQFGLVGTLQLAAVTLALALCYWNTLGRPSASRVALAAAGAFCAAGLLVNIAHGYSLQVAEWQGLAAIAGVVFGTCLCSDERALKSFGYACAPLALLAVAEIAGFHNPWPGLVHATNYLTLDNIPGANRAQSTFGHPLIAGGCLAGAAAIMWQSEKVFTKGVAALIAGGAVATVSRSAVLGLGASVAIEVIVSSSRGRALGRLLIVGAVTVAIASQIPALSSSFTSRFTNGASLTVSYTDQPVRAYALQSIEADLERNLGSLLLGHGVGYSAAHLQAIGDIDGYGIFDNQYVTSTYDIGLIPMFVVALLVLLALAKAPTVARRRGLPALGALAVVMYFVDGGYWLSLGILAWIVVGLATAEAPY